MPTNVKLEDMYPVIAQVLEENGEVSFKTHGISMHPMLANGRDTVTLKKVSGRLKKYDLPFYRRDNGQFVLHRIVGINSDGYITRGDNQYVNEYGVRDDQIIGVVVSFVRKGKEHKVTDFSYKLYCVLRCNPLSVFLHKLRLKTGEKILKKSNG